MARDLIHQACREALEKDGWTITADPYPLTIGDVTMEVDMAAEQVFSAEKGTEKIAVEVKSFLNKSKITDFYAAKGQYDLYKRGLEFENSPRKLFLAIDHDVYITFFQKMLIDLVIKENRINIIVFDVSTKEITTWIQH